MNFKVNTVDKEFIRKTVDLYADTVLRVAFHYTRNRTDAEDIMQEVFLALIKQPQFSEQEHIKAWLIRVAINKGKDFLKSSKRKTAELLDVYSYNFEQEESEILQRVKMLPPFDRNLIYLYYFENYSVGEIAKILKTKEGTVYVRLKRARYKLKDILEEEGANYNEVKQMSIDF